MKRAFGKRCSLQRRGARKRWQLCAPCPSGSHDHGARYCSEAVIASDHASWPLAAASGAAADPAQPSPRSWGQNRALLIARVASGAATTSCSAAAVLFRPKTVWTQYIVCLNRGCHAIRQPVRQRSQPGRAPAESDPSAATGHQQQALHGQQRRRNRGWRQRRGGRGHGAMLG